MSLTLTFLSDDQTPKILQPGKEPLDFPTSPVSLQPTSVLGRISSVTTMWGDDFDAVEPPLLVEMVRIICVIADQILRCVQSNHLKQRGGG